MTYLPCSLFRRTPEERVDQLLSWQRPDKAFFAAGACHILAFAFLETYPEAGFSPVGLWSDASENPHHVYVIDGTWAFDHDGWTPHTELLATTRAADPHTRYQPHRIEPDLDLLCERYHHRARHQYAFDPWQRALRYLALFPPPRTDRRSPSAGTPDAGLSLAQQPGRGGHPPPGQVAHRRPADQFGELRAWRIDR